MNPTIPVLILAAGSSSRMGQPKQLLPVGNTTLLGSVIEIAREAAIGPVYCVLGKHAALIRPSISPYDISILINPDWASGLSSSIIAGIQHLEKEHPDARACLILLGDQPLIPAAYLRQMIGKWQSNPEKVIASAYEKKIGVPAIFPKGYWPMLHQLQGDRGAGKWLNEHPEHLLSLSAADYLFDIDSPEDYERLRNQ